MESLAMVVLVMMLVMLASALVGLLVSWKAREARTRIIALLLALPGAVIGTMFIFTSGSFGGVVTGLLGLIGFVVPGYRLWASRRELATS